MIQGSVLGINDVRRAQIHQEQRNADIQGANRRAGGLHQVLPSISLIEGSELATSVFVPKYLLLPNRILSRSQIHEIAQFYSTTLEMIYYG